MTMDAADAVRPDERKRRGQPAEHSPASGIGMLILATFLFSLSDLCAKMLSERLPALEVVWLRYLAVSLAVIPGLAWGGQFLTSIRSAQPMLQVLRALFALGSAVFFLFALKFLSTAEATATYFVSPILVVLLSALVLREPLVRQRCIGAAVGFAGVLIIVQPGTDAFRPASLLPMLAALSWAGAAIATRLIRRDRPVTTIAYTAWTGCIVSTSLMPFVWVPLSWGDIAPVLGLGMAGASGHWLIVEAYRRAELSVLAPFSYSQIVWASVLGVLAFGSIPGTATIVGSVIICATGLYVARYERGQAQVSTAAPSPAKF